MRGCDPNSADHSYNALPKNERSSAEEIRVPFQEFLKKLPPNQRVEYVSFASFLSRTLREYGVSTDVATLAVELDFVDDCMVWRGPRKNP